MLSSPGCRCPQNLSEIKEALLIPVLYRQAGGTDEGLDANPFFRDHFIERLLPQIRDRVRMKVPLTMGDAMRIAERTEAALGMRGATASAFHTTLPYVDHLSGPSLPQVQMQPRSQLSMSDQNHMSQVHEYSFVGSVPPTPFTQPEGNLTQGTPSLIPSNSSLSGISTEVVMTTLKHIEDRLAKLETTSHGPRNQGYTQTQSNSFQYRGGNQVRNDRGFIQPRSPSLGRAGPVKCFRCQRTGHVARVCRAPYCPQCQRFGHLRRDCQVNFRTSRSPTTSPRPGQRWNRFPQGPSAADPSLSDNYARPTAPNHFGDTGN